MKPTLVYCYDALCGWCYGFSPVVEQLKAAYANDFNFEILSGGMVMGSRVGPVGKTAPFIKTAYKTVEKTTGIMFGDAYLADLLGPGDMIMNSWKPSLALTVFKSSGKSDPFAFASAMQRAVYIDGHGPDEDETYRILARDAGLDPQKFLDAMHSFSVQRQTRDEFERVQRYGVSGFPTILFDFGGDAAHFVSGYRPFSDLNDALRQLVNAA